MNPKKIPLVNLKRQYSETKEEIFSQLHDVFSSSAFIKGPYTETFERDLASYLNIQSVVGCASGTAALSLALEALGIKAGDDVLVPAHTFIATAEAVSHVGANPIFVDCNPDTYCIEPSEIESAITPKTTAIIPVHLYGNICDMDSILRISNTYKLRVIEDCSQAHIASLRDKFVGTMGDVGTFSFYPGKNLGACGDAGATCTDNLEVADRIRKLSDHGRKSKYEHDIIGYNQRMDGIQGAILSVKLSYLEKWTTRRRKIALYYDKELSAAGLKTITPQTESKPVYHLYTIEVNNRDDVQNKLMKQGIETGVHYPIPLHRQAAFANSSGKQLNLPVTEAISKRVMSIPICGSITDSEVEYVCKSLLNAL